MKKQNIIVRTLKNRVRKNEDIWTTKKAEKALLQIAGTLTFIVIVNSLINIAQAEPTVHYLENKPIDYGASKEPQSEISNDSHNDEGKDGTAVDIVSTETIEEKIARAFPEQKELVTAVFKAESGLRTDAIGWNCYYNGKSKACLEQDRDKAWSVDCGIAQINVKGKSCPKELFNPEHNLELARKKYDTKQGLNHWYAYINQTFIKYL